MKIYPVFLTTTGTYYKESVKERPNGFSEYQFILTVEGEGFFEYKNRSITLKQGSLIFIPPGLSHKYKKKTKKWITHWLTFNGNNIDDLFNTVLPKNIEVIQTNINDPVYTEMIEVNKLTYENYKINALKISAIIYTMLANFVVKMNKRDNSINKGNIDYVESTLRFINNNYWKDISINQLAELNDISPQYLCRLFKLEMGLRPFEYIKRYRINKAKTLILENPNKKIEKVSKEVGFNNPSYFGAIFKLNENMTPKEFLKLHNM